MNTMSDPDRIEGAPRVWLIIVWLMVAVMVAVGGITRLTGSGLSMVEWHPLMGAIPPGTEAEWLAVFERYKQFPQYLKVNDWMQLADFKRIFFWEYFHRLLGRLLGLVFFIPWLYFVLRKRLQGVWARRTFVAFLLGGAQGLLGWFMVRSGLVDVPAVSHFRLAAHLSMAFVAACWIAWILFLGRPNQPDRVLHRGAWALLVLVAVQIVWGAFMAGARAGFLYSTFPTYHGVWVPPEAFATGLRALLDAPAGIHFAHRTLGWLVGFAALGWALWARARGRGGLGLAVAGLTLLQFLLGVATVMSAVQIFIATAHQLGGLALLTLCLYAAYSCAETSASRRWG